MFNIYALLPLGAFCVHTFMLAYIWAQKRRGDRVYSAFLLFIMLLVVWAVSDFLIWSRAVPVSVLGPVALAESAFWMPTGLAFMMFVYRIIERPLDRAVAVVAAFVAVCFAVSVATGGFIVGFSFEPWGVRQVFSRWFGPYMLGGIVVPYLWALHLVRAAFARGMKTDLKRPLYTFFAGTAGAICAGGINDVILVPFLGLPSLQIASTVAVTISISMYFAVRRYDFITVNPEQVQQVFDRVFDDATEGMVLADRNGIILRSNRAARGMAGIASANGDMPVERVLPDCAGGWKDGRCEFTRNGRRISVVRSVINDKANPVSAVYTLRDVTADRETEARLYRINEQMGEQNRCNLIRAGLWRLAADESLDGRGMIQSILDAIGPEMGVNRACFGEERGASMVCTVEWCRSGTPASLGTELPMKLLGFFMQDGFTEINEEQILRRIPEALHAFARPFISRMMHEDDIASFAYVPLTVNSGQRSMLVFDICRDLPDKPVWTGEKRQLIQDAVHILTLVLDQRRARAELKASNVRLEERVGQRTTELHAANATLERSLREKDVLLKEIHHRVKNNLQVISSLLALQSRHLGDPLDVAKFVDSQTRIRSMALIHERLYQTGDLARVRFDSYIERLLADLYHTYSIDPGIVRRTGTVEAVEMTVDKAIPCSLIVNELVSNAFKYAYDGGRKGAMEISLAHRPGNADAVLTVRDDGPGLPRDMDAAAVNSLGLQLVNTLTEQLDGVLEIRNDCGAVFVLSFPLDGE